MSFAEYPYGRFHSDRGASFINHQIHVLTCFCLYFSWISDPSLGLVTLHGAGAGPVSPLQLSEVSCPVERKGRGHNMLVCYLPIQAIHSANADIIHRHIFCLQCADRLGLSIPGPRERRCPACQAVLSNPDDAVSTVLNPTEDYKTSVLSGLDPNTIMECAARALMFWSYQTTQEMCVEQSVTNSRVADGYIKLLPRVSGKELDRKVCESEHGNG